MIKISSKIVLSLFFAAIFFATNGVSRAATIKAQETELTAIDEYLGTQEGIGETLLISPDNQHIALVVKRGEEMAWQINGKAKKYFSALGPGRWSPDSQHFAYSAATGSKWQMIVDDKSDESYTSVGFPVWSPDSSKGAYVAQKKGKWLIVDGKKKSDLFQAVNSLQYSADGESLAAVVRDDNGEALWIDGEIKARADEISDFMWSEKGHHFAYVTRDNRSYSVHHDQSSGQPVEKVELLTMSPDGEHVAYVATIGGSIANLQSNDDRDSNTAKTRILVSDEKTLDTQNDATFVYTGISYSPDGKRIAWTGGHYGYDTLQIDDKADRSQYAGMSVFVDGKRGDNYSNVSAPVWSSDSAHIAYGAVKIQKSDILKYLITDDKVSEAFHDITQPLWNPVSNEVAFAAVAQNSQDKSVVYNNGKSGPKYDTSSDLLFSDDGKYFSYLALDGDGVYAIINDTKSPKYDGFLGDVKSSFDAEGNLCVIALKDKTAFRVKLTLQ